MLAYLAIAMFVAAFSMVANRLSRTVITAPQVFLGFGLLVAWSGMVPQAGSETALHIVAEVTLIVLLFLDAAQIDVTELRSRFIWPARMLLIGLPLAVIFGTLAALAILPGWSLAGAVLLAAILAPTDAALGQAVITNPAIPDRPRRALVVESGLNDGLALPAILMFAVISAPQGVAPESGWLVFAIKQLTLGPLVGLVIGGVAGRVLIWAKRTDHTADIYEGIGALALAATSYLMATAVDGNGFISAFCAGLAFGAVVRGRCAFVYEFTESEGQLLAWASFFLMGAVLVPEALPHLTWQVAALILVSLFIVRPLAIWLSLAGTDATTATRLFFGWFGPRGLATALFALLVVDQLDHAFGEQVLHIAVNAVWISAVLHGLSAVPGAALYARLLARGDMQAEHRPIPESSVTGPVDMD